jgi:hypothetical protein
MLSYLCFCRLLTCVQGGGLLVSLYNAPSFFSVSEKTRFSSSLVPVIVCPPLNFSCFHSFLPTWRSMIGYVAVWSGHIMSPCSTQSNSEAFMHFKLSAGHCPVNDTKVCQILQQNTIKVVLNGDVLIDTSFSHIFREILIVPCRLWPAALNSIQIWWRHQRMPNFDDLQFQLTTSCSSKMTPPSSLWFYSRQDDHLAGGWPRRVLFQGRILRIFVLSYTHYSNQILCKFFSYSLALFLFLFCFVPNWSVYVSLTLNFVCSQEAHQNTSKMQS